MTLLVFIFQNLFVQTKLLFLLILDPYYSDDFALVF